MDKMLADCDQGRTCNMYRSSEMHQIQYVCASEDSCLLSSMSPQQCPSPSRVSGHGFCCPGSCTTAVPWALTSHTGEGLCRSTWLALDCFLVSRNVLSLFRAPCAPLEESYKWLSWEDICTNWIFGLFVCSFQNYAPHF